MATAPDFAWYRDAYGGSLPAGAFSAALVRATPVVTWLCANREPAEGELGAWMRAVCAAADVLAEYGDGAAGGFTIGDYKVTNYVSQGVATGLDMAIEAAIRELSGTTLLFSGVR